MRVANSTPIVGTTDFGNVPLIYRFKRWVFPTPASPTRTTIVKRRIVGTKGEK